MPKDGRYIAVAGMQMSEYTQGPLLGILDNCIRHLKIEPLLVAFF